jgi:hypothetical protein
LIALLVICLGLATPLVSGLLLRLVSVSCASGCGIEIKVKRNIAVGKETLPQLKEIISEREN